MTPLEYSRPYDIALVLSGGNALGAFQGGVYQALRERDMEPEWVIGASVGAVNGAIICGNAPDQRVARLRQIWGCDGTSNTTMPSQWPFETIRRTMSAATTMAYGHPGFFVPHILSGRWWNPLRHDEPASLYDLAPLENTLQRSLDFDLLNEGAPRFSVTAVDVRNGAELVFDTAVQRLEPVHIRASASLLPLFAPVAIGDRLLGDAGISANLPVDIVLAEERDRPLLCIAIDLLPLEKSSPVTLGDAAIRAQDLVFAAQSRRALAAWSALFRKKGDRASPVTLLHLAYQDHGEEVTGKAFDFSQPSAQRRWQAGYDAMKRMLNGFNICGLDDLKKAGLSIYQLSPGHAAALKSVHLPMRPHSI